MGFEYLKNTSLAQAREDYLAALSERGFTHKTERVSVPSACGRVTAKAVYASICSPHYESSAMDGIALNAALSFGAGETSPVRLAPGQFQAVDTGDMLPEGCDAVVMTEDVVWEADGGVKLFAPVPPWHNIRQTGEDICAGEMILPSYSPVGPAALGAIIAGGVTELEVIRPPVVGIIPTGDEIVPPFAQPGPGEIPEFNSAVFAAMIKDWGGAAKVFPICPDRLESIRASLREAVESCDIVILNAGSSAGRDDYACTAIESLGEVLYHGLAIKPGKPAILGLCGRIPVLGVPGYPVSGIIVVQELLRPILDRWFCREEEERLYVKAAMSRRIVSGLKYQEFVRVNLGMVRGEYVAVPLNRGAGVVSSFVKADGILEVPQGMEGYEPGTQVHVRLLRPRRDIENTLLIIGSHDPLLDELSDMMHRSEPGLFMRSIHVGSMGGIMALRRGEAHMAGTHLLNESDGKYNEAYVERYFPAGGVRLVECVGRVQGLMIAAGNPLDIDSIDDLKRPGLRYVNRQKGSGTRVLADYLCREHGIDTESIYGYSREEYTHMAVAAQIASGSADLGMGIYSAAKLYGLGFVPICTEQYDLLIPDYAWETPMVKKLLQILKSDMFRHRLEALGGYTLEEPGAVRKKY